jgi:hypothetical protein
MKSMDGKKSWVFAAAALLMVILECELLFSVHQNSQTFDESAHIYSGYSYWKLGDFGINPEHPPLVKLEATLPLLPTGLADPPPVPINFRAVSGYGGILLLYSNDADSILFKARAAVSVFALTCALLVFLAGYEMFGAGAGLIALLVLVFEPNILANGALVGTDTGAACLVFGAVYAFYRYCKKPSILRLAVCCLAAGLALAAKHSAVLLLPMFGVLALFEILRRRSAEDGTNEDRKRESLRLLGALAAIAIISVTILWSFYGFRYAARPGGAQLNPTTADYLKTLKEHGHFEADVLGFMEQHHLLPEAYLFGMNDIVEISLQGRPTFLLGHPYATGHWFYFPVLFVIKSTIGFMLLLLLTVAAREIWRRQYRRELVFLLVPPLIWVVFAMRSKLDLGLRHILPVYPFLIVLAGAVAWMLARRSRGWAVVVAVLIAFHVFTSLHTYPNYLPYSNEAFGGTSNTYRIASDANVGWESGLKMLKANLDSRHITHCWFAFDGLNDPGYYHIPCTPLPSFFSTLAGGRQGVVPEQIGGPVFIGSNEFSGFDWGPDNLNPYQQFYGMHPTAVLGGEILEYDGSFTVTKVAALSHFAVAYQLLQRKQIGPALEEFKTAEKLNPEFILTHEILASLYAGMKQPAAATSEYQAALHIYQTGGSGGAAESGPPQDPLAHP